MKTALVSLLVVVSLASISGMPHAQGSVSATATPQSIEPAKVSANAGQIVSNLTESTKINYIGGASAGDWQVKSIPAAGLPPIYGTDGGLGVRYSTPVGVGYPSGPALASTWSIDRAHEYGAALGRDARSAGFQAVTGPGMDMYRTPFGGREAEYLSGEDPFLGAVLAPAAINAIQSQGVWATAKHFVCNDQETNRFNLNVIVDQRALHEIYLMPFESAAKNGAAASVMCAFNQVNGNYACQNYQLEEQDLKGEFGFNGFIETDYNAIKDGLLAAQAGTDLDMPDGAFMNAQSLALPLQENQISLSTIDDKVARIVNQIDAFNFLSGNLPTCPVTGPNDCPLCRYRHKSHYADPRIMLRSLCGPAWLTGRGREKSA